MLLAGWVAEFVVEVFEVWLVRAAWVESFVFDLWRWNEPDLREVVGVIGEPESLMGDVGESRSLEPVESFVRFFLRKPRVGIGSGWMEECRRALAVRRLATSAAASELQGMRGGQRAQLAAIGSAEGGGRAAAHRGGRARAGCERRGGGGGRWEVEERGG